MRTLQSFLRRALPFGAVTLLALVQAHPALAAEGVTIGARIKAAMDDMVGPLLFLVTIMSTLGGVFLFTKGLMKLKDAHQDPQAFRSAATAIFAATLLVALPEAAGIGMNSVMGTTGMMFQTSEMKLTADALDGAAANGQSRSLSSSASSLGNVGQVNDCITGAGVDTAVPCMAKNLSENVVPVGIIAAFAFVYIWGMWGLGSTLFELARHSAERGGGTPQGFWMKGLSSILALSMPTFLMAVSSTVTGSSGPVGATGIADESLMTYNLNSGSGVLKQYAEMITYVFHILALFGVLAFAKGLFILRGVGDQRQNATFSHGIVFMLAGVMLANAKLSTCTIMGTISGFSSTPVVGFCT